MYSNTAITITSPSSSFIKSSMIMSTTKEHVPFHDNLLLTAHSFIFFLFLWNPESLQNSLLQDVNI